ncbi:hypothetical protein [Mastigocladopsis repens]|uniref:hypothetical protein n=1 Tax=Mastigocladopsis repens TaxID=221287 RepID=UPI0002E8ABCD|nr:hypothetical protein [Mastigocladopsis repens]
MVENSQITFVCCVESGWLETQTARMIESLRRWGGKLKNAPVFAVTPCFGPPLAKKTHQIFDKFQIQYLSFQNKSKYSWNKFLNKPSALLAVEKLATTECIGWLDSDLLIVNEPDQLTLNKGESFVACASDKNIGTTGPQDPYEPYWQEICSCVGIDIEDLPWIKTEQEGVPIRLYWNSGVFVYRRSTNFADHYLQTCIQLCDSYIASHKAGFFFNDQVALGLTMVKMGIPWRALPYSHNYAMGSKTHKDWYNEEQLRAAKIIHYHDSMWPSFWETFVESLGKTHPPVADWLTSIGPMKNQAPLPSRAIKKIIDFSRSRKELAYMKACRVI